MKNVSLSAHCSSRWVYPPYCIICSHTLESLICHTSYHHLLSFFSGYNRDRLPELSRSTSPPPRRSTSNTSAIFGHDSNHNHAGYSHVRRRSDLVPVRALLILPDSSVGHEVTPRKSSVQRRCTVQEGPFFLTVPTGPCIRLGFA